MTALNEPKLQKQGPGDRTQEIGLSHHATGISETSYQIIIFAISAVVILTSVYCLSHGITIIFMHLYYLPIVLLAYRYRYRGFVLSVFLSLAYIVLVFFYSPGQNEVILGALFRFVVFIGIAAVVAYLSEQFHQSKKSLTKVADIQKSSLMNANVWLMLLDRRGSVLLWNNAAERISGYSAAEVTGSNNIWKLLYPDKDYRAVITKKIERIIAEESFFENLETTIRTRSEEEKVISWNTRSFPETSEQEASSIAIGIDITERKVAEERLFAEHELVVVLASTASLKDVLPLCLTTALHLSGMDSGGIYLVSETTSDIELACSVGLSDEFVKETSRIRADSDSAHLVLAGRPIYSQHLQLGVSFTGVRAKEKLHAIAIIPILFKNRVIACFNIASHTRDTVPDESRTILESIAALIGNGIARFIAEEATRTSEEKYRGIFDNINDGLHIYEIGPDSIPGKFLEVNEVACRMLQYTREEMLEHSPLDFATDYDRKLLDQVFLDNSTTGHAIFETRHQRKDGTVLPVAINSHVVNLQGKRVIIAVVRDITERKRAEEAQRKNAEKLHSAYEELTASEEKLQHNLDDLTRQQRALRTLSAYNRSLLEASLDPLVTINPEGKIADVNLSTEKVTGYSREELIGTDFTNYFTEPEKAKEGYLRVFAAGTVRDYPLSIRNREGHITPILYNATVYRDEAGNVSGVFATARDISERKLAEDAIMRVNQKLNVLSQLTRKDLTNQIFVLSSYLELTKIQLSGQDRIIETLQKGIQEIRLITETIEYSKDYQDMGAKHPKWQNVKLTMLLGLSHIPLGKIQNIFETDILEIFADPLLEKVCQRLFENSVKHGYHVTRIRVWHTVKPDIATIFFEDDGIGISAENKEQIFLRGEGTGRDSMRSLIFVREILDITGITIRETGEPGKGARFEITVPKGAWRIADVK